MKYSFVRLLGNEDKHELDAFLSRRFESSVQLLQNLRVGEFKDEGKRFQATYVGAFDKTHRICGVVAHCWNGNTLLQSDACTTHLCRSAWSLTGRPVKGLIGPSHQVRSVANELHSSTITVNHAKHVMTATTIPNSQVRSGQLKVQKATNIHKALLTSWRVEFATRVLGKVESSSTLRDCRVWVDELIDRGQLWIGLRDNIPVSCAAIELTTKEFELIGGIWTPLQYRRHGFATQLISTITQAIIFANQRTALLFVGKENIRAKQVYFSLGFCVHSDFDVLLGNFKV